MSEPLIIKLKNVSAGYGNLTVLDNIDLEVSAGDVLGIMGPNGGGKTTMLKVILGLLKPSKGEAFVFGKNSEKLGSADRQKIGYVPQEKDIDLTFPVSVLDVVLMGAYSKTGLLKSVGTENKKKAFEILARVGMKEYATVAIGALSGGQRQRVLIARALLSEPKLLILDEPTTGVDSQNQATFYNMLSDLKKDFGLTVLMVSHDIGVVSKQVNKISCVNRSVHVHGPLEEILKNPDMAKTAGCDVELMAQQQFVYRKMEGHDHD